ncbi:hypothetical protein TWF192_000276 [Orbilia oligospora]|nr:hypothetical protein TWF192_000276 [Orbilia oligospora]
MLPQLPNELIGTVLGHLPRRDLFNIALCSRLLHSLVIPILYSNIELRVVNKFNTKSRKWENLVDPGLTQLLLHDERKYGKYIRRIRVVSGQGGTPNVEVGKKMEIDGESGLGGEEVSLEGREREPDEGSEEGSEGGKLRGEEQEEEESDKNGGDEGEEEGGDGRNEEHDEHTSVESSMAVDSRPSDTNFVIASQISSLMKIGEAPLTGFKWLLNIDISPDFFQRILVEGLGSKLSTLEILSHGSNLPARKLPEDRLPCLRKLLVRGVYSPQRVAELHYILRASPGLQSFGFGVGEAAIPEADLNSRFRFSDSEMVGIGLENHDFGWERAPTNWTDFIETCIFKNLQRLPLRELVIEDVGLTPMMAKLLPLGSLRHMSLSGIGTSFGFIETIDTQKLRLETCNIVYERVGENCLFRKFIGDLQPGLRHLGFRCKAWDVDIDLDELGHTLEVEYPGIFLLPEGFTEKQKDTLETLIFNVTIPDWKGGWVTPPKNFEISSEFSKLTEASIPLLMRNTMSKKRLPNGPIPGPQKIFWTLIPIPLSGASGLPNLRTLTLTPISTEYRADFVENIFETGIHFKGWVEMYQEQLVKYVEDLVGTYATGYMQVFGIDRRPSLEWIFVIGEESCHFEVGFRIEWSLVNGESKYDSRITLLPGTDARNSIKTEDMRFRKIQS